MSLFYDIHGNLPKGVYQLRLEEIRAEFGSTNSQREWLMHQLNSLLALAQKSNKLKRFFVWGSFASQKPFPKDLDVLLVFSADFADDDLSEEIISMLDHEQARMRYQADVFWVRESMAPEALELLLDTYQKDRQHRDRGIVEIVL